MTPYIASTESKKKRILARYKAGKHTRMTTKELSAIDYNIDTLQQDGSTNASIDSTDTKKSESLHVVKLENT